MFSAECPVWKRYYWCIFSHIFHSYHLKVYFHIILTFFFKVEKDPIFFHKGIFFFGKVVFPSIDRVKYMAT